MKKNLYILLIFILISILLIFNNSNFLVSSFSSFAQNLSSGPRQIITSFKTGFFSDSKEIEKLKAENKKLQEKFVDYQKIKQDNDALRSQFADFQASSVKLIPAKIVGFMGPIKTPQIIILDQGRNSNIKEGMSVVSGRHLVGKIKKVLDSFSQAETVFNPGFSITATAANNNSLGVVAGYQNFILLNKVSSTDKIDKDELVLTKGEFQNDFGISEGLIIGKITSVNNSKSSPFQAAQIESLLNFPKLRTVFITTL